MNEPEKSAVSIEYADFANRGVLHVCNVANRKHLAVTAPADAYLQNKYYASMFDEIDLNYHRVLRKYCLICVGRRVHRIFPRGGK